MSSQPTLSASALPTPPAHRKVVTEVTGVFSLPWQIARDEGLFAAEGVEVEFRQAPSSIETRFPATDLDYIEDHRLVPALAGHTELEAKKVDVYRACEWGQVRRSQDSGHGRIISKRSAVVSQAIFSAPGSRFTHPQTLANERVAVRFHHGSHYAALQSLEGFLKPEEIRLVHLSHVDGYEAVRRGDIAAVTLMEPWITLAEKEGFQRIIETHYQGSEIASPDVDPETWAAVHRAVKVATDRLKADKKKYLHYLIAALPEQYRDLISEDDFHLPRLLFVDPAPYDEKEFQQTYDWLVGWGLIAPDSDFTDLVDNRVRAAA
ncbi:ABC transporter substrate-binding protein [Brevundimonas sp. VNH65]|uniref:ABC transporter substrate-binding protein n=1 Tax=Brevundimonas sp. VNH65 TaxID=3400917 RepID=UPI003BFEAABF